MIDLSLSEVIRTYRTTLQQVLDGLPLEPVHWITQQILATYDHGGCIYVFGNGGSAATASHMACDVGKNTVVDDLPRLRINALTDNTALISALANDLGYESIFSEQLLQAPVQPRDLVIAISGSGNSPNVLAGVAIAAEAGACTVGITGRGGGRLAPAVDCALVVPSDSPEIIEDVHLMINHAITSAIRTALHARVAVVA